MKAIVFLSLFISFQSGADNSQLHQFGRIVGLDHDSVMTVEPEVCFECIQKVVNAIFDSITKQVDETQKLINNTENKSAQLVLSNQRSKQLIQNAKSKMQKFLIGDANNINANYKKWKNAEKKLDACQGNLNNLKKRRGNPH